MALTSTQSKDAYQFFIVAFGAAPGVEYMNQLDDAYGAGMTTKEIVNVYATKPQFLAQYPSFLSNEQFADKLIENVVGASATAAAKTEAKADVVGALNEGWTKGDVVFQIFTNLANKPTTDALWGATAQMFNNKVEVAQYATEDLLINTTDLAQLRGLVANVTAAPASVDAAKAVAAGATGQTFTLTTGADAVVGTAGNDTITALSIKTDGAGATTFSAFDAIDGGAGVDTLNIYTTDDFNTGFPANTTVKNVEIVNIHNAESAAALADASKFEGVEQLWQIGAAANVTKLAATTTAGFRNVDANIAVAAADAAATAKIALDNLGEGRSITVTSGAAGTLNSVTVAGTVKDTNADKTVVANVLDITVGKDVESLSVNTANKTTLTVTNGAGTKTVSTVDASASAGAVTYNAATTVATVKTGAGDDVVGLNTVASGTAKAATVETGAGKDTVTVAVNANSISGVSASVTTGEGNDTITINNVGTVALTLNAGAGDDTVTLVGGFPSIATTDKVDGGDGIDTLKVAGRTLTATDYTLLTDVIKGFEAIEFTSKASLDASRAAAYKTLTFANDAGALVDAFDANQAAQAALTIATANDNAADAAVVAATAADNAADLAAATALANDNTADAAAATALANDNAADAAAATALANDTAADAAVTAATAADAAADLALAAAASADAAAQANLLAGQAATNADAAAAAAAIVASNAEAAADAAEAADLAAFNANAAADAAEAADAAAALTDAVALRTEANIAAANATLTDAAQLQAAVVSAQEAIVTYDGVYATFAAALATYAADTNVAASQTALVTAYDNLRTAMDADAPADVANSNPTVVATDAAAILADLPNIQAADTLHDTTLANAVTAAQAAAAAAVAADDLAVSTDAAATAAEEADTLAAATDAGALRTAATTLQATADLTDAVALRATAVALRSTADELQATADQTSAPTQAQLTALSDLAAATAANLATATSNAAATQTTLDAAVATAAGTQTTLDAAVATAAGTQATLDAAVATAAGTQAALNAANANAAATQATLDAAVAAAAATQTALNAAQTTAATTAATLATLQAEVSSVTKVAADQALVAKGSLTAEAAGYVLDSDTSLAGNQTTYAGSLNITAKGDGSVITAKAESVALTVAAQTTGNVFTVLQGDLKSASVTVNNGVNNTVAADATEDTLASAYISNNGTLAKLASLTLVGNGAVEVVNVNNTDLVTVNAANLGGTYALGADKGLITDGLTYVSSNAKAETITLGSGLDNVTLLASTVAKTDTITGFSVVDNAALTGTQIDAAKSDALSVGFGGFEKVTTTQTTLGLALVDLAASTTKDNVVFQLGGDTYAYADSNHDQLVNDSDVLVKLTGTVDLDLLVLSLNAV